MAKNMLHAVTVTLTFDNQNLITVCTVQRLVHTARMLPNIAFQGGSQFDNKKYSTEVVFLLGLVPGTPGLTAP